jgi:trimethylamine:corrinoid methyltransferase-like protein
MIGSRFSFFTPPQVASLRDKVFDLLDKHGVKLDPHPRMFSILSDAGAKVDAERGMVRFPRSLMEKSIEQAPKTFFLGARGKDRVLELPRTDGTFYARTNTGAHGWIEPESGASRKITVADLGQWAKLINHLDEISFLPYLFCHDVPVETADIHALSTVLKNTDKHVWVQPYSIASVRHLIKLGAAVAGGEEALKTNPVISMIACSLTPRSFKHMDIEIVLQSARAFLPIHACSLPGSGGTAPATLPAVIILASAEILAMLAMAQAVRPGTPVVACPIIFSTDMRSGRSLQSSVEAMKGASGCIQFIKAAFGLPTHNYGSGSDAVTLDGQCMSERAVLTTLAAASGLDILGGAGQIETATVVSPLQLMVDNEVIGMARQLVKEMALDDDQLAWDVIVETKPGDHFLTSPHTLAHCRDGFMPQHFVRVSRESWERQGRKDLLERALAQYRTLAAKENPSLLDDPGCQELDRIVRAADQLLVK